MVRIFVVGFDFSKVHRLENQRQKFSELPSILSLQIVSISKTGNSSKKEGK